MENILFRLSSPEFDDDWHGPSSSGIPKIYTTSWQGSLFTPFPVKSPLTFFDLPSDIRGRIYDLIDSSATISLREAQSHHIFLRKNVETLHRHEKYGLIMPRRSLISPEVGPLLLDFLDHLHFDQPRYVFKAKRLVGPPNILDFLGLETVKYFQVSGRELERVAIQSVGTSQFDVTVIEGGKGAYVEVSRKMQMGERFGKKAPGFAGVKWTVMQYGIDEYRRMLAVSDREVARQVRESIREREGTGVSLVELGVIADAAWMFAKEIERGFQSEKHLDRSIPLKRMRRSSGPSTVKERVDQQKINRKINGAKVLER